MPWTGPEAEQILSTFWANGAAACPNCKAALRTTYTSVSGGYALLAECPRGHGTLEMHSAQDPLASTFRAWTGEEVTDVVQQYLKSKTAVCPVDGARLQIKETPHASGNVVAAHCPRCGRGGQSSYRA